MKVKKHLLKFFVLAYVISTMFAFLMSISIVWFMIWSLGFWITTSVFWARESKGFKNHRKIPYPTELEHWELRLGETPEIRCQKCTSGKFGILAFKEDTSRGLLFNCKGCGTQYKTKIKS